MIISCKNCQTNFVIPKEALMPLGRKVRCSKCSHLWFVKLNQETESQNLEDVSIDKMLGINTAYKDKNNNNEKYVFAQEDSRRTPQFYQNLSRYNNINANALPVVRQEKRFNFLFLLPFALFFCIVATFVFAPSNISPWPFKNFSQTFEDSPFFQPSVKVENLLIENCKLSFKLANVSKSSTNISLARISLYDKNANLILKRMINFNELILNAGQFVSPEIYLQELKEHARFAEVSVGNRMQLLVR